jgi:NAD(P)H-hydrate repair Nnr-like enzyme with NAD(P)H-hydrate dehydratase domain
MADLMSTTPAEVAARPMEFATAGARKFGAIVVLKGPATWISDAEGHLWLHEVDAPGLGTSGSGDVLAGLITGLLARGAEPVQAAAWGVAVHARAGQMAARQIGHVGFLARELLGRIPAVLERLERH